MDSMLNVTFFIAVNNVADDVPGDVELSLFC